MRSAHVRRAEPKPIQARHVFHDPVGLAVEEACRLANVLGTSSIVACIPDLEPDRQRLWFGRVRSTWADLCGAMNLLSELAEFSCEEGYARDAEMHDRLVQMGAADKQGGTAAPIRQVGGFAYGVADALQRSNQEGTSKIERVAALVDAFRWWPVLCRRAAKARIDRPEQERAA